MNKKKLTKKIWYGSEVNASGQPIIPPLAKESNDLEGLHEGELFLHNSDEQPNIWIRTSGGRIVPLFKGGGGTAESISWINITDKPTWLVDGIIDYSEIVGAPDLSLYAKKSYVDLTFVTLSGNEDVSGIKNFINGIKLSGIEFKYDSENNAVCLQKADGTPINFYVTGGMSMYGQGNTSVKSIMDAIAANLDRNTLDIKNGLLTVVGGTGGVDESAVRTLIESYDYATKDFVREYVLQNTTGGEFELSKNMVIDALGFTPYSAENPNGYITAASIPSALKNPYALTFGSKTYDGSAAQSITASDLGAALSSDLSKYLPLSGGTISGSSEAPLTINSTNSANKCYIPFTVNGVIKAYVGYSSVVGAFLEVPNGVFRVNTTGITYNGNTVYHAGNFNPANYLPLSGGILTANNSDTALILKGNANGSWVSFRGNDDTFYGSIGVQNDKTPYFYDRTAAYKIWHAGNDGSGSGLDADLLDGKHLADILASNVASATKLQTPRTIWGQSFDGTADVTGSLKIPNDYTLRWFNNAGADINCMYLSNENKFFIGNGVAEKGYDTYLSGKNLIFRYGTSRTEGVRINSSGNVGIGTTSPSSKLHVYGGANPISCESNVSESSIYFIGAGNGSEYKWAIGKGVWGLLGKFGIGEYNTKKALFMQIGTDGNVGIGVPYTENPSAKLHVVGNILATGGVTMQSQRSLKNVVDERGLSLAELRTIKPTRFTWKDKRDDKLHIGGIADDVEKVLPEVVYKTADGTLTMDYSNAGFAVATN